MTIRSVLRISLLAGVVALAASPVLADVKAGVDAWSRGDYARAIAEWQGPADRGDPDAMFNLAQAYKLGRGVPADLVRAEDLFGKAAAKGHLQAADNYGLLLFQRGERARAMPYIRAASDRGDPRSQYLLGIAHFNGDIVAKDWVRAYALVTLSQQAGLPQAAPALAQMDNYIPIEQRQQSVSLASELAGAAQATRERQLAAMDLGNTIPSPNSAPPSAGEEPTAVATRTPELARTEKALATAQRAAGTEGPATAGADYARPQTATRPPQSASRAPAAALHAEPRPAPTRTPAPAPAPATVPAPAPAPASGGAWRVQFGAFGVAANADALWNKLKSRPEIAGHAKLLVPAGRVNKLQAGGFASQGEAQAACTRLTAAGYTCIPVRD